MPPIELLLTRRLLLAKQLLTETTLPMTEVAFASGFSSLRRFNDAFSRRYGMPPTRLRRKARDDDGRTSGGSETSTLLLAYRPPYDWDGILAFLSARALAGVEHVTPTAYARTVQLGTARGWIRVTHAKRTRALVVEFTHSLTLVLPALLSRIRALFDLDARPDLIARHLRKDARLAAAVRANPGRRVPGAFHGFEMGLRAILGQQITVAGGDDHRRPLRRRVRRAVRHASCRAQSPDAGVVTHRRGDRRRDRASRHHRGALPQHHRAGAGGRVGQPVARRRHPPQPRRLDRAARRAAGHRAVDGALHRDARPALAGRVSEGRHRRAQQARRRDGDRG